jgi:hypothetical protein
MVNITLRVLSKPDVEQLPRIFRVSPAASNNLLHALTPGWLVSSREFQLPEHTSTWSLAPRSHPALVPPPHPTQNLGLDWDERVLPSIGNEVLKAVVAQYQAEQLLTQVGGGWREAGCCAAASRGVALHSGGKGGEGMEVHRTPYLPASLAT